MEDKDLLNYVPYPNSSPSSIHGKTAREIWRDYCEDNGHVTLGKFFSFFGFGKGNNTESNNLGIRRVISCLSSLYLLGKVERHVFTDCGETHYRYQRVPEHLPDNGRGCAGLEGTILTKD